MKQLLVIVFLFCSGIIVSQNPDTLTLGTCYDSIFSNYPASKQKELYSKISELKLKNLSSEYLPVFNFIGQASVQSDVPHLAIEVPPASPIRDLKIPIPPLDQYKVYFELSQIIWDGGMINARKEIEKTSSQSQLKSIEAELFFVREKINMIYFNLLFVQQNKELLILLKKELEGRIKNLKAAAAAGATLESNVSVILAETYKVDQLILEIQSRQQTLQMSLQELIHRPVSDSTVLINPEYNISDPSIDGTRPELQLFDLQLESFDKNILLMKSIRRPKLFAFGQAGYGRPGLNMLSNTFDPFGIVGVRLNWTIYDWNQKKREIKMMEYQKEIILTKKETYSMNQRIGMNTELNNIKKYNQIIEKDNTIIQLRNSISSVAASRFDNGSINATDFLIEKNAEIQAKINFHLHQLQLLQAQVNYLTISGKIK